MRVGMMRKPLSDCRLYAFIDLGFPRAGAPELLLRQLADGGADLVQLRAKTALAGEVRSLADRLLPLAEQAGIGLVLNDHWRIACELGVPFAHLGEEDFFGAGLKRASQILPPDGPTRLGLTACGPDAARRSEEAGAAYLGIGPVFATATKPEAQPASLDFVRWAAGHVQRPWFAIGGITLETLDRVLEAGARRICVISAILNAPDVARACQAFRRRLDSAGLVI